ncbi:MAG: hypothetical protein IT258_07685 [Saprospiraceae bacterium]|nr:hypothetical protein [Saprospiraceae bacterium]
MQASKIIKMYKSLTTEEWKYLRWFVQSNFFNTDPNLLRFYEALAKHHPGFESKSLTKENLYHKVFAGQAYHDGKWRNLLSKMAKVMEDYFIWLELEHEPTARQKLLTQAFGRRNLYEQYEKSINALSDKLEEQCEYSVEALQERAQINLQYYHHPQTNKVQHLGRLQGAMDDLDHYYFSEKLRLASDLKVFENMVAGAEPIRLKTEIQVLVGDGKLRNFLYLKMYDRVLGQLEQDTGLEKFQETLAFFSGIAGKLSEGDRQFGLLHLLNFAINQANKGEGEYYSEVLKLYKLGLEQKVLVQDEKMSDSTFINIVTTGSRLKEFDWTNQFIRVYESNLPPNSRAETRTLSLGIWHFHQSEYSQAIDLLLNYSFQDFKNVLSSKNLLLRCYFELFLYDGTYYPLFISFSNAFDKFVKREKQLALNRKVWYKNLLSSLLIITRHKHESTWNQDIAVKIKHEISSKPMYLKAWILERIESL